MANEALGPHELVAIVERWQGAFGGPDIVESLVILALANPAANRYKNPAVYVESWLRRELEHRYAAAPQAGSPSAPLSSPNVMQELLAAVARLTARVDSLAPTSHAKVTINAKKEGQPEVCVYHPNPTQAMLLCERLMDHMAAKYTGTTFIEHDPDVHAQLEHEVRELAGSEAVIEIKRAEDA